MRCDLPMPNVSAGFSRFDLDRTAQATTWTRQNARNILTVYPSSIPSSVLQHSIMNNHTCRTNPNARCARCANTVELRRRSLPIRSSYAHLNHELSRPSDTQTRTSQNTARVEVRLFNCPPFEWVVRADMTVDNIQQMISATVEAPLRMFLEFEGHLGIMNRLPLSPRQRIMDIIQDSLLMGQDPGDVVFVAQALSTDEMLSLMLGLQL